MAGYHNQVLHLNFDHLVNDPDDPDAPHDTCWVAMRNPKLRPMDELRPDDSIPVGPDGRPLNPDDAVTNMYAMIAALIMAWRVYSTDVEVTVDENTGEAITGDATLLPPVTHSHPATADMVRLLPQEIQAELASTLRASTNPQ